MAFVRNTLRSECNSTLLDPHSRLLTDEASARHADSQQTVFSITTHSIENLDAGTLALWMKLHQQDSRFASPYYHPSFTRSVAAIRDDVEVATLRDKFQQVIGILPFQRSAPHVGSPIGGRMNDFHQVIAPTTTNVDWKHLLQALDLKRFGFHALTGPQSLSNRFAFESFPSHYIDLSAGAEQYRRWVQSHSKTIKRMPQKIRALERDIGPVTFEFECRDAAQLEQVIAMKRAKYQRTKTFDILSVRWAADLLRQVFQRKEEDFRGLLSLLMAGDRLVAAHMGMIAGNILHYWFPVYETQLGKYSPGYILMMRTCQAAAESGLKQIDLSYGDSEFKAKFANGSEMVSIGSVNFNRLGHWISQQRYFVRKGLKRIPHKQRAKRVLRKFFPSYGSWHFK